eukprot:CAMPEP_0204359156 /NCGR_PEP_ID=MMETSP0469-20131031/37040_1 /ASSEMBLY_ACC=CAM_ASM_000384 /TAXON_ID=2969 /ORGANISM="Oxyrrhis marina" /LENGTH=833 /DNA_ID=CAMNT_0051347139 /DNA_START=15 /DNA_END=2516 /DNA_ORIENTATION=-
MLGWLARFPLKLAIAAVQVFILLYFCYWAYDIRLYPVKDFGPIIHEFDPWFNYRAAQYLADNGLTRFFQWYDYMSWYPLGRPVGTTIYPGMQMTSVAIWHVLKGISPQTYKIPKYVLRWLGLPKDTKEIAGFKLPEWLQKLEVPFGGKRTFEPMSVNDVCVYTSAWFGSVATVFLALLAAEVSGSWNAGVIGGAMFSIMPAHIMRSVAGEYDNECVAVAAICSTFFFYLRSLRSPGSWPWGVLAGLSYAYMVAAWGGFIFVLNLIGIHAAFMVVIGRYSSSLYKAYTLFFTIGTFGAVQVPVVGWNPFKSMEQLGPLVVFLVYQLLELCDSLRRRAEKKKKPMTTTEFVTLRVKVFAACLVLLAGLVVLLWPTGYFGPISSRIRGLFVKHTKTGNPLVDSVAEHQPASDRAFFHYMHNACYLAFPGFVVCFFHRTPGAWFMILYALVAYHFSTKMSRLIIICGPIVSVLGGVVLGTVVDWAMEAVFGLLGETKEKKPEAPKRSGGMGSIKRGVGRIVGPVLVAEEWRDLQKFRRTAPGMVLQLAVALGIAGLGFDQARPLVTEYVQHCDRNARGLSNPQIVFMHRMQNGQNAIIDDYLKAYEWLRDNTPEDARVMAWWDYGYQITGVGNRTTIADGNTWNHEHIATLGRCLTAPEQRAWNAIRHLADYVLVWAGGHGDDLAKSPHMARIGNSVFPDICGDDDPTCSKFGFYQGGEPTPMMAKSLLYKLHSHNIKPDVKANPKWFTEAHTSKHGLVRIFKVQNVSIESKEWVADPKNRICDKPGSWYCVGQYPPALQPLIAKRKNFAQLEDFNRKGAEKSAYTKYIEKNQGQGV